MFRNPFKLNIQKIKARTPEQIVVEFGEFKIVKGELVSRKKEADARVKRIKSNFNII